MALKWMSTTQNFANFSVDVVVEEDGVQLISWGKAYIRGIHMLLVHLNGVEQPADAYDEFNDYSIMFKNVTDLYEEDVVSIYYIPTTVSLGDIRVVVNRFELDSLPNPIFNEVAIAISDRKFYIYGSNGWREFVMPFTTQNIGVLVSYEKQQITDVTIRTFELENIVYYMNTNNMMVFIDGKKIDPADYVEVDNKTITFLQDLQAGSTEIEFMVLNTDTWEDSNDHTVEYAYNLDESVHMETYKVGVNVVKQSQFNYDTEGNIIKEIVLKGPKTITRDYVYDVSGNISGITVTIS